MRIPDYLEHILEAIKRIFNYVEDIGEVGFLKNALVQDAVLRNLEIIGEASNKLVRYHDEFIKQYLPTLEEQIQNTYKKIVTQQRQRRFISELRVA